MHRRPVVETNYPYAVIVGAFRIEDNAKNLVSLLQGQGIQASIYDRTTGGLYRVAAGTFQQKSEAIANLQQMKTKGYPGSLATFKIDLRCAKEKTCSFY